MTAKQVAKAINGGIECPAPSDALPVAIYLRISNDPTKDELGVDRQEKACRELIAAKGWQVYDVYKDNDKSAWNLNVVRLEYERMIRDIKAGKVRAIVAFNGDRIHRRLSRLIALVDVLNEYKVEVATVVGGHLDLATAHGRSFAYIVGILAEMESATKSERVKAKMTELANDGKWKGGRRPFGYESDGVTIRESERAEVERWAKMVLDGKTLRYIANDCETRGIVGAAGKIMRPSTIREILLAPRAAGMRQHRATSRKDNADAILVDAVWPALIDPDLWRAVRMVLAAPSRRHERAASYLLTGLLYAPAHPDGSCSPDGYCLHKGAKMTGRRNEQLKGCEGVRSYYGAGSNVRAEVAEDHVIRAAWAAADELQAVPIPRRDTSDMDAERFRIAAEMAALKDAHDQRLITASQYVAGLQPLNADLAALDDQMAAIVASDRPAPAHPWINRKGALKRLWSSDAFTVDRQREALAEIFEYIIVMPAKRQGRQFDASRLRYRLRGGWQDLDVAAA